MSDQTCDCCGIADTTTADDRWLTEPVMNAPLPSDVRYHTSQFFGREIETLAALAGAIRAVIGSSSVAIDDLCHVEADTVGCKPMKEFAAPSLRISSDSYSRQYETPHRATTADETYCFRCFYDGIVLAHLADEPVEIRTESPVGELIEMRASPHGTIDVTPSDAVMSFGIASDVEPFADDANPTFGELTETVVCPYVKAFPTRDAYTYWAEGSDGATVGMALAAGVSFAAALTNR